jgi:nicotinamidase-related amidase
MAKITSVVKDGLKAKSATAAPQIVALKPARPRHVNQSDANKPPESPWTAITRIRRQPITVMAANFRHTRTLLPEGAAAVTSAPVRDLLADHLLTPQNTAFLLIDYQPQQLVAVRSMDRALLVKNAISTVRTIKTYGVPVVHSTVNVTSGREQPTLPELADLLTDDKPLDRTTINSWEDIEFVQAVHATGRRKLIICALWTDMCMAFDALREGYEVYLVIDAIGGTSPEAHRAGLDRVIQAGGQPISWVSLAGELLRDWARPEALAIAEIVVTDRLARSNNDPWQPRLAASLTAKKAS